MAIPIALMVTLMVMVMVVVMVVVMVTVVIMSVTPVMAVIFVVPAAIEIRLVFLGSYEVHRPIAGMILVAMLAPIPCMPRRYV